MLRRTLSIFCLFMSIQFTQSTISEVETNFQTSIFRKLESNLPTYKKINSTIFSTWIWNKRRRHHFRYSPKPHCSKTVMYQNVQFGQINFILWWHLQVRIRIIYHLSATLIDCMTLRIIHQWMKILQYIILNYNTNLQT